MIPRFAIIKQQLPNQTVQNIAEEIRKELARIQLKDKVKPGMRIAITAGSRGIYKIPLILRTVVDEIKAWGGEPFVIPTMGSHGGATAEGQVEFLRGLGITEESMGVPILATMDVIEIGSTAGGLPVYLDAHAAKADGIIVIGRIKPHTDFRGPIESGLHKMIAIGLGKHKQPLAIHRYGVRGFELIPQVAQVTLSKAPILCGLAILENGYDETAHIEAVLPEDFAVREPELLLLARQLMPTLPVNELDVLIVGEMGKNFSGTGMDTNIIGRVQIYGEPEFSSPTIQYIVALRLSEATHGNALGIGLADFTTERVMHAIDYPVMRENVLTSSFISRGKIPMAFPNDRASIAAAQRCLWQENPCSARMMYIPNTLEISKIAVSESLLPLLSNHPGIEILTPLQELEFDQEMNLDINFV
ncbi:MAG TPA: lactate racemase domain-containing protein [Desulfosporosinus sp.]|nr:lactate racemase domain-containing protein [Desulfosporosinus sp.]